MPSPAREDDSWGQLDWVDQDDSFDVALSRPVRTLRQHLRLVESLSVQEFRDTNPRDASELQYIIVESGNPTPSERWVGWVAWCQSELRRWDVYDFATVLGIALTCIGLILALFPVLRGGGILFPIGAATMAFAAYGARRRDAYTD
jgi:hypothetical protein